MATQQAPARSVTNSKFVIAVPNLEVSSAFYRDVLGFEIHELAPGWLLYKSGNCCIMAGECSDAIPPNHREAKTPRFQHYVMAVFLPFLFMILSGPPLVLIHHLRPSTTQTLAAH